MSRNRSTLYRLGRWVGLMAAIVGAVAHAREFRSLNLQPFAGPSRFEAIKASAVIPRGAQVLGGIPFDLNGTITLTGKGPEGENQKYRVEVTNIPVGHAFARLHLLGGASWTAGSADTIALIRLRYADGSIHEIPVRLREQLDSIYAFRHREEDALTDLNSRVVWRSPLEEPAKYDKQLRLLRCEFPQPHPDKVVTSLDLISTRETASLTVAALTTGGPRETEQTNTITIPAHLVPKARTAPLEPATLTGRVLTAAGDPVEAARVQVLAVAGEGQTDWAAEETHPAVGRLTLTDAVGAFALTNLPGDRHFRIAVLKAGFATTVRRGADPAEGALKLRLQAQDLSRWPTNQLARGVVLGADGVPLADAIVEVTGRSQNGGMCFGCTDGFDFPVICNARGEFVIASREAFEQVQLEIRRVGWAPAPNVVLSSGGKVQSIGLQVGGVVTGRVLDRMDHPVPGAEFEVMGRNRSAEVFLGRYSARTDSDGRFEIRHIPSGGYSAYARLESLRSLGVLKPREISVMDRATNALGDLRLEPGIRVTGKVLMDDGSPPPPGLKLNFSRDAMWTGAAAMVSSNGHFALTNWLPGSTEIRPDGSMNVRLSSRNRSQPYWGNNSLEGLIDQDTDGLEIELSRGAYAWRNFSGGSSPRPEDTVGGRPLHGVESASGPRQVMSGTVVDDKTGQPVRRFSAVRGGLNPSPFPAQKPGALQTVRKFLGRDQPGFSEPPFWMESIAQEFTNGNFRVETYWATAIPMLRIDAEGYESWTAPPLPGGTNGYAIRLMPAQNWDGVVLGLDGRPLAGVQMLLAPSRHQLGLNCLDGTMQNYGGEQVVTNDLQGRFQLKPVPNARRLFLSHPTGYLEVPVSELRGGMSLRLEPWAALTGVMRDARKAPVAGESLSLYTPDRWAQGEPIVNFNPWPKTDAAGRFTFIRVPPGKFQLNRLNPMGANGGWQNIDQGSVLLRPGVTNDLGAFEKDKPPPPGKLETFLKGVGL